MFALIDKERMCVCYKHQDVKPLADLLHIEFPHCVAAVIDIENPMFANFSDMELKILYTSMSGQKYEMFGREGLIKNIIELLKLLPESDLNLDKVTWQADLIEREDLKLYQYNPDGNVPKVQTAPLALKPLTASASFTPVHYPSSVPQTAPASEPQAQTAFIKPRPPAVKTDSPKSTTQISAEAPKAGSKTGRVWEIAEKIWQSAGQPSDIKPLRGEIVSACEAEGINGSTASVQFSKWRASKS